MSQSEIFLSLVVPVYNEANRLDASLPNVFTYLSDNFAAWEVIYSDDGSTDGTRERLLEIQKSQPCLRLVGSETNKGKGSAVRIGLSAASGNVLLFSDADFSTPIEDCQKLLDYLYQGYDIAIGSRALRGSNVEVHQSWLRESIGKLGNVWIRSLLPVEFEDTQCGFKMLTRDAANRILPKLSIDGFAFDVEILTVAAVQLLKVAEVPVTWRNVLESKVHPVKNSFEVLRDVLQIRYRLAMGYYY